MGLSRNFYKDIISFGDHLVNSSLTPIEVQAHLHHQYFIGLQLMVSVEKGAGVVGNWMFNLFRKQHEDKFLSSFNKLGLENLPHAVACAKYHVLSNGVGGVRVEYIAETDKKAWIRFRYPRWMYDGPAICGIPIEASRGFLKGWYARNGISLQNPRLGFVCVSEDLSGDFGFCGYFKEFEKDLSVEERLQFSPNERPPQFNEADQPIPPREHWSDDRLAKANRNYSIEFCRNGIGELLRVIGLDETLRIGKRAARLTGLQQYSHMGNSLNAIDGTPDDAARFLIAALEGMGDTINRIDEPNQIILKQSPLRIVRGLQGSEREVLLACWIELWRGMVQSHREFMNLKVEDKGNGLIWYLSSEQ